MSEIEVGKSYIRKPIGTNYEVIGQRLNVHIRIQLLFMLSVAIKEIVQSFMTESIGY